MTIHDLVSTARGRLRAAGIATAEADLDARVLAEHVLGWDAARYFTDGSQAAPEEFAERYEALVARREAREPVAYITGRREFWGLSFAVSPSVLIPRPETELIVEAALELYPSAEAPLAIADPCTGSGCLAITLARERPRARVVATDISSDAIAVAMLNADRLGVADRVTFHHTDLLDGVEGPFDLIVSNPPYVADQFRRIIQPEVREHEPSIALFGGDKGFDVIQALVPAAAERLKPGGMLLFEFGFGQDVEIEALIASTPGLAFVALRPDLQGIARTAVARKIGA